MSVTGGGVLSQEDAERVAARFAEEALALAPDEVVAVVLIGSLGAGDYMPGRSDIDTAVILSDTVSERSVGELERLAAGYVARYSIPKGLGVVPVRIGRLAAPLEPAEELAPELLDIKERGRVLAGSFDLASVPTPTEEDLRSYCQVFFPWLRRFRRDADPSTITLDAAVNSLIYELRLAVLTRTGRYVLPKRAVVPALAAADPGLAGRLGLDRIHRYLTGEAPAPPPRWLDDVRDQIEQDNSRMAAWAFCGSRRQQP